MRINYRLIIAAILFFSTAAVAQEPAQVRRGSEAQQFLQQFQSAPDPKCIPRNSSAPQCKFPAKNTVEKTWGDAGNGCHFAEQIDPFQGSCRTGDSYCVCQGST